MGEQACAREGLSQSVKLASEPGMTLGVISESINLPCPFCLGYGQDDLKRSNTLIGLRVAEEGHRWEGTIFLEF